MTPPATFASAERLLRTFAWLAGLGLALVVAGVAVAAVGSGAGSVAGAVFLIVIGLWCIVVGLLLRRRGQRTLAHYQHVE